MSTDWLLAPPVVFVIVISVIAILARLARSLAPVGKPSPGKGEPYACGQNVPTGKIQPGYSDFFHFAFLFTIVDVAALLIGTAAANAVWLAIAVLAIIVLALIILFRGE
jgi:NADH:ubiquinone oxidoreductase subunit 3 (subunit A)